jgi:hypothetical protein
MNVGRFEFSDTTGFTNGGDLHSHTSMNLANFPRLAALLIRVAIVALFPSCAMNHHLPMYRDDFGLNFVPVKVNGHSGVFLVDSGASHTILDQGFAKRCIRKMVLSDMRLAWLGSGDNIAKEGVIEEIQVGNYRQVGPFKVHVLNLDAINNAPARQRKFHLDGIIGADFFISHRALIDYGSNVLRFQAATDEWMKKLASPTPTSRQ